MIYSAGACGRSGRGLLVRQMSAVIVGCQAEYLGARCGVGPEDIMVSCIENNDGDWSFGFGRAQFLTGEL